MRIRNVGAIIVVCAMAFSAGAAHAKPPQSRIFPYYKEEIGSLLLGQIVAVASRQDIVNSGTHYQLLLATGIPDEALGDGRLAIARTYCCGGKIEESDAIWLHVPPDLTVETGDIVEIRMGRPPKDGDPGVANAVTSMRQKFDDADGRCRWEPNDPRLWMNVLYCDGLREQGWSQRGTLRKVWYKPASSQAK